MQYVASRTVFYTSDCSICFRRATQVRFYQITNIQEFAGEGILAEVDGKQVLAGNHKLMQKRFEISSSQEIGTSFYLLIDQSYSGYLLVVDTLKEDAVDALVQLKQAGEEHSHVDGRLGKKLLIISGSK